MTRSERAVAADDPASSDPRHAGTHGLLDLDGRIVALGIALLADLGFHAGDDLRGLDLASLWPHAERAAVTEAIATAGRGGTATLALDLAYLTGDAALRRIVLEQAAPDALAFRIAG